MGIHCYKFASNVTKTQKKSDITHKSNAKQRQEQQLTDKQNDLIAEEKESQMANEHSDFIAFHGIL